MDTSRSRPAPLRPGSTLRFRVLDSDRNLESAVWSVVSSRNSGDLYLGAREAMGEAKISVHGSGTTRLAWTAPAAEGRVLPGADRLIRRWRPGEELVAGWKIAARVAIPDAALSAVLPPLETRRVRPVVTLPAPGPGRVVDVLLLLGSPESGGITVEGDLKEVGRMLLGDGTKVFVVAFANDSSPELDAQLARVRAHALACGAADRPVPRAIGWGDESASGGPLVLDAGDPRPAGTYPPEVPRYDGPANLVVGELPPAP